MKKIFIVSALCVYAFIFYVFGCQNTWDRVDEILDNYHWAKPVLTEAR